MIYLNVETKNNLWEDNFWTWFQREFPSSKFEIPQELKDDDIVLTYSTLGFLPIIGKQAALCWELYPLMQNFFGIDMYDNIMQKVYETARYSTYRIVASKERVKDYIRFGSVDIIPIGVDTNIFKPMDNKEELKEKYNIPKNKRIGIWIGTYHPIKGLDNLLKYASENSDIYWIIIWEFKEEALEIPNSSNYIQIPQHQISELINCADFFLSANKLSSYFTIEWEAMACNIPFVIIESSKREFYPSQNPRDDVFERGWDRNSVKKQWEEFLSQRGVKW